MGKALLLMFAAVSMSSAYYALQAKRGVRDAGEKIADHQYEVLSREAALTGFTLAKQKLAEGFASSAIEGYTDAGTFETAITVAGSDAKVVSTGVTTGAQDQEVPYEIRAHFKKVPGALSDKPPIWMRYAVASEGNLNLNGSVVTEIYVQGEESSQLNANMHTNGNIHIDGNKVHVEGFGTFLGSGTSNPGDALQGTFTPNYNPNGDPGAMQVTTPLDIPSFDINNYTANLTMDQTDMGDVTLSGSYSLGTREDPYIWHIGGDLSGAGSVEIDGYVMFVVEGNVNFTGNLLAGDSGWGGADESSIAVYSGGTITLDGTIDVYGQFLAADDITTIGNPTIYGSLVTDTEMNISGSPDIYYRLPSVALTTMWQEREERLKMVAYSEW